MHRITLGHTSLRTSILGFGTAALTSLNDRRAALRLLEAAFEAGITHFDTARLYGFGHAENIVGEFLRGRRDAVTVATKFGLEPPSGMARNATFISLAKRLVRRAPFLRKVARRRAAAMVTGGNFTPEAANRSLETSLRELGTDHVDLLLLHECTLEDSRHDDLLQYLQSQVTRGTVRAVGVATAADNLRGDLTPFPAIYQVVQLQNNVLDRRLPSLTGRAGRDIVTHSALAPMRTLPNAFDRHPQLLAEWLRAGGPDPREPGTLARLLLAYAVGANHDGVVLFSTTHPERIHQNVDGIGNPGALDEGRRFAELVRAVVEAPEGGIGNPAR
jgi:aryl-alcohol dehydrogenase-like predicted oxidoreductase